MVQKLNRIQVEAKLKSMSLPLFTPREFKDIFGVSENTASVFIKRNLGSGLFLKLKNGFYAIKDSSPSPYSVANKLYQPSYVSLEKALSHYGVIPETVYAVTSVTTKATREFETPSGTFSYQKIKRTAFTGYGPVNMDGETVLMAQPEKALVDYLYFSDLNGSEPNERMHLENLDKKKVVDFAALFERNSLIDAIKNYDFKKRI